MRIYNYHESPEKINLSGAKIQTIGLELEFLTNWDLYDIENEVKHYNDVPFFYLEWDNSVSFELISNILSLPFLEKNKDTYQYWIDELFYNTECYEEEGVGNHLHLNREFFSSINHLKRFIEFFNVNYNEIFRISERYTEYDLRKWAAPVEVNLNYTLHNGKLYSDDRYYAINCTNSKTIEVRIFSASYNIEKIINRFLFIFSVISFTRKHKNLEFDNYLDFLFKKAKTSKRAKKVINFLTYDIELI